MLLNTLVYFNTKFFKLKSADDHMKLAFPQIVKHWKKANTSPASKSSNQNLACQGRSPVLRYNPPPNKGICKTLNIQSSIKPRSRAFTSFLVIRPEERRFLEQHQDHADPLRCPIKLYDFYISKW